MPFFGRDLGAHFGRATSRKSQCGVLRLALSIGRSVCLMVRAASVPSHPAWRMRWEMMSQSFTARLDQRWIVHCY